MSGCDCKTCISARDDIVKCLAIYKQYKWLVDSNILDFYVNDHWDKLPNSWKSYFADLSPSNITPLLDPLVPLDRTLNVTPLQILCLRQVLKNLNVSRNAQCLGKMFSKTVKHTYNKNPKGIVKPRTYQVNAEDCKCCVKKIPNEISAVWKRVSSKKKYEIRIMADICCTVARNSGCNALIDFGSGLGHFSRILAYFYGFKVCCFESQAKLSMEAQKLDVQFEEIYRRLYPKKVLQRPKHIIMEIDNNSNISWILEVVKNALRLNVNAKFGIIGLHPCGDLASVLLKFFKDSPRIVFVNVASCCYMKLTTNNPHRYFPGYPVSRFLDSRDYELSYNAKELSCHAIENFIEKLNSGNYIDQKTHAYRALLEKIIVKYNPKKFHSGLRNVKCTNEMTFAEYCSKALKDLELTVPATELESLEVAKHLKNWHKVVIFYSLRLMFAPMIETIILLDRFLYVADADTQCALVPVFNPKWSPRNHIFIGTKNRENWDEE